MYILALVLAVIVILVIIIYNTILSKKNKLIKAYSSLDVMLKKRYDLIPNIVECVKGYKNYESQTLEKIISLRKEADKCNSTSDMEKLQNKYRGFISEISFLSEQYPDLKASENFLNLQKILNEVEEQISAARRTYNAHVENYNTYISFIPINLFANLFGFKKYDFFEISEDEKNTKVIVGDFNERD